MMETFGNVIMLVAGILCAAAIAFTVYDLTRWANVERHRQGYATGSTLGRLILVIPIGCAAFGTGMLLFEAFGGILMRTTDYVTVQNVSEHHQYSLGVICFAISISVIAVWKLIFRPFKYRERHGDRQDDALHLERVTTT